MHPREPGITGCSGTFRAASTPSLSSIEQLARFTPGRTTSAEPAMEGPALPSAAAPIATSSGFTRSTQRPWGCLKALAERSWTGLSGDTGSAPQNIWADSNGPDSILICGLDGSVVRSLV